MEDLSGLPTTAGMDRVCERGEMFSLHPIWGSDLSAHGRGGTLILRLEQGYGVDTRDGALEAFQP